MKKTKLLVLTAALVLGLGTTVFADLPSNTLIIGNNAYSIEYIMQHIEELNDIINNSNSYKDIYYKKDASNITSLFGNGNATEKTVSSSNGSNNLTYYYLKDTNTASKINYSFNSDKNEYIENDSTIKANITRTDLASMYFINVQVTDASIVDPSKLSAKYFKVLNANNSDLVKSIGIPGQGESMDDYQITLMTTDPTLKIAILANDKTEIGQATLNVSTDLSSGLNSGKVIPLSIDSADENKSSNNGNISGNVNNNGLLADDGSWIYYSNLADGGKLYKKKEVQSSDKTVTLYDTKVCEDNAKYINVMGDWIYYSNYSDGQKIYKIKKDGTGRRIVCRDQASYLNVSGEYIYYAAHEEKNLSNIGKLYKVRIDSQNATSGDKISDDEAEYVSVNGDVVYFVNVTENRTLYSIHTDGTYRSKIQNDDAQVKYATLVGDYIYYITYDGDLYRISTDGQNPTKITVMSNIINGSSSSQVDDKILGINVTSDSLYYWSYQGGNKLYKASLSGNTSKVTGDKVGDDSITSVNVANNGDAYYTNGTKLYIANPVITTNTAGKTTYKYSPIAINAVKPTLKLVSYDKTAFPTKNVPSSATVDSIVDYLPDKVTGTLSDSSVVEVLVDWDLENPVIGKDGSISYKGTVVTYGGTVTFKMTLASDPLTVDNVTSNDIVNQPGTSTDTITVRNLKDGDVINVYRTMDADGKGQELLGTATASGGTATIKLTGSNVLPDKAGKVYLSRTSTGKTESELYSCEFGDATLPTSLTASNITVVNYGDLDNSSVPTTDIVNVADDSALQDGDSVVIYRDAAKTMPIANVKVQLDPNSGTGPFDTLKYEALNIKLSNANALKYDATDPSNNYIYVARNTGSAESEAVKIPFGKDLALPMLFGDTNILDVHGPSNNNKVTVNLTRQNGYDYYYKVVSSPIDVYLKEDLDADGGWNALNANTPISVSNGQYVYVVQVPTGTKLAYKFGYGQVTEGTNLITESAPAAFTTAPTYSAGSGAHNGCTQITGLGAGTFMYKVTSTDTHLNISAGDSTVGNGWTSVANGDWIPVTAGQYINVVSVDSKNTITGLDYQQIDSTKINSIASVDLFGASDFVFADPTGAENNGKTKATTVPTKLNITDKYLYKVADNAQDAPTSTDDVSTLGYQLLPDDKCIPAKDGQYISIIEADSTGKIAQRFGVFKAVVGTNEAPTLATFADSNNVYLGTKSGALSFNFNFVKGQVDKALLLIDDTPAGALLTIGADSSSTSGTINFNSTNSTNTTGNINFDASATTNILNSLSAGNHTMKIRLYSIGPNATKDAAVTSDSAAKTLVIDNTPPTAASSDSFTKTGYAATDSVTLKFSEPVLESSIIDTLNTDTRFGTSPTISAVDDTSRYATTFKVTLGTSPSLTTGDTITITKTNVVDQAKNTASADVTFNAN